MNVLQNIEVILTLLYTYMERNTNRDNEETPILI